MAQHILADKRDRVNRVISFISGRYVSVCVCVYIYYNNKKSHTNTSGRDHSVQKVFLNASQAHLIFRFSVTQSNKLSKTQLPLQIK